MAILKVCENCKKEFKANKNCRKFCSKKCRIVPTTFKMVGETFGWLTVIEEIESVYKSGKPQRRFKCKCKCGNIVNKTYDGIKNKTLKTPSCGCFMHWFASNRITHGMTNTKIYHVWANLKERCYKEQHPSFKNYGAKGVGVCERWEIFENFYEDMGDSYKEGLTLDRYPDKNGNYEPSNCRWATYTEQMRNINNNRNLTVRDYTRCVSEFTEVMGYPKGRINGRLKLNWIDEDAVLGRDIELKEINYQKIIEYYEGFKG